MLDENCLFKFGEFERETGGYEEYVLQAQAGDGTFSSTSLLFMTLDFEAEVDASIQLSTAPDGVSAVELAMLDYLKGLAQGSTTTTTTTTPSMSSSIDADMPPLPLSVATSAIFATGDPLGGGHPFDDQPHSTLDPLDAANASTSLLSQTPEPPKSPSKRCSSNRKTVLIQSTTVPNTPPVSKAATAPKDNGTPAPPQSDARNEAPKSKGKGRAKSKRIRDDDEENVDTTDSKRARRTAAEAITPVADSVSPQTDSPATTVTATAPRGKGKKNKAATRKRKVVDEAQPEAPTSTEEATAPPTTIDTSFPTTTAEPEASKARASEKNAVDSASVPEAPSVAAPTSEADSTTRGEADIPISNQDACAGPSNYQDRPLTTHPYPHLKTTGWLVSHQATERAALEELNLRRQWEAQAVVFRALAMAHPVVPGATALEGPKKKKGTRGASQKTTSQRSKKKQSRSAPSTSPTDDGSSTTPTASTSPTAIQTPGSSICVTNFEQDKHSNQDTQRPVHQNFSARWLVPGQKVRGGRIEFPSPQPAPGST